eukprot:CAMPEP_0202003040 /NCGR_PEP_ID=MMETSP0905-20130828/8736_1 /ASSEMBLY_ACC=CAM_ASM_000554 /TAXON_ID=420261 /ORGANISM="Thalassiosira antarctica, Strain CCMP982" /LENGTH=518 /DNA_ID=CAMNT_0048560109 /DNA_START=131 /DNA_END=1687 /DNA_ORIENTATION=+
MYSTNSPKKKKSRESEIALLEKISTSLDTYIGDNPLPSFKPKNEKPTASDASKNAAKNFLAAKTLSKNIAKACAQEKVAATVETEGKSNVLFDSLVEEYNGKYPSLTKKMLVDGIGRYNAQNENASGGNSGAEGEDTEDDDNDELKFGRIIFAVDTEMNLYHAKIEALKKSRELAASEPEETPKLSRKRKSKVADTDTSPKKPKAAKQRRARPKENTSETFIINEIVKRYAIERRKHVRLPNGLLETIVDEAKREHKMEFFDMPLNKLDKKVRAKYNKMIGKDDENDVQNRHKAIVEEVYARYSRTKEANGGIKLPAGTMDSIIEGVKLEYGFTDIKMSSLKVRCQARFTKENPELQINYPGQIKWGELPEEDRKRRQLLMNEITARYVQEKEAHPKKLADGTLDRIIQQTKTDLGITEFEVPKASIRGRINRKSFHVQTLGGESPYDAIDEPLVATINSWLSQGISVTRAQGLDLANRLLKGKQLDHDTNGGEIVLNAKWWRNFLDRNKRRLVCSGD